MIFPLVPFARLAQPFISQSLLIFHRINYEWFKLNYFTVIFRFNSIDDTCHCSRQAGNPQQLATANSASRTFDPCTDVTISPVINVLLCATADR